FPKPAYLFALVAGRFGHVADHYQTLSGRKVTLDIYVEPGKESRAHHALFALKKAMRWDEETYGLEYDLDRYVIVSVPDFNMGAMENKGLNVFNDKYILVSPESATDSDYEHVESVVGHEYFHNWTGNRVTLRDWFQLSLKEGLTVYREQQFAAAMGRAVTKRLEDVDLLRTRQFSEDAGPLAHPVRPERYEEINNFYTATIYEKGAEVIRMLSTIVGEEGFIDGVKHYLKTWDGHAATVENFIAAIGESNQKDLSRFITWYEQPGTPMVRIASSYDKDRQIYTLRLEQERPKGDPNKPLMIPVKVGLLNPQTGEWMLLDKRATKNPYRVLLLEEEAESFNFMHVETEPLPAILMDFSAPVHIEYPYTPQERMIMVEHVADPYLRWDSAQQLYTHNLKQLLRLKQQNKALLCDTALGTLIAQVATQKDIDQNLAAMLLQLPRMTQFLQGCKNIDPLEVEAAYTALEDTLAKAFEGPLATCYEHLSQPGRYAYSPESVSKRALKNACLGWLVKTQQMSHIQSAVQQYSKADNMTDAWAALASVVLRTNGPEAKQLLTLFQERWSSDALVMDKWLSLQASSWQANTLETVKQLSEGTVFNWKNPNKVYALIRTFVVGNPLRFHRKDGKGYQFLSHCLRKVDALNPQVASSLVEGFADWKRYAAPYSTLMKAEMDALLKTGTLSKNVQERLSKIARA
ncbi:MAG: aminopeptidase N, partial [Pseudomonadota bacterium]